jgi:hypothetical protein
MKKAHLLIGLAVTFWMMKPGVTSSLSTVPYKTENTQKESNPSAGSKVAIEIHQGEQEGGGALW